MNKCALSQRGAMFGIDARLAVFVLALAALSISLVITNRLERNRVVLTDLQLVELRDKLLQHNYLSGNTAVSDIATDLGIYGAFEEFDVTLDAWGNAYQFAFVETTATLIQNAAGMKVYYFMLVSGGPDETVDSVTAIPDLATWQAWAPLGDDIGIKFSNVENVQRLAADSTRRLQVIQEALQRLAAMRQADLLAFCDNVANQLHVDCNINGVAGYQADEERNSHFLPREASDVTTPKFYPAPLPGNTFTSDDISSMQDFIALLGGIPLSYAQDGFDRTLKYQSNVGNSTVAPYIYRVWY